MRIPNIGATKEPTFLTPNAKKAFNQLRLAFIKVPILRHFDPESHIRIKINASGYAIAGVLSQLNLNFDALPNDLNLDKSDFGQWHLVAYFSRKIIPAETQYKTHNAELLAIIKAFKTRCHYLEGCKHKVFVLTNHNNLCWFMNIKSLSSRQVKWTQKLLRYYFQINYCQGKVNRTVDALSCFLQKKLNEKEKLKAENIQIFHCLQSSLTRANFLGLSLSGLSFGSSSKPNLLPLHQVLICDTYVLLQLCQF